MMNYYLSTILALVLFIPPFRKHFFTPPALPKKGKSEIQLFEIMRGLGILAVIWIHVGWVVSSYEGGKNFDHFVFRTDNLMRFAIPFFLISSGYWTSTNFTRKFLRLVIPFVLVSFLFTCKLPLEKQLFLLVTGQSSPPYYFMIVLFQCYLLMPLMKKFVKHPYFLHIILILSVGMQISGFFSFEGFPLVFKYLFFFAYGMKLKIGGEKVNRTKSYKLFWGAIILAFLGIVIALPEYHYNTRYFYSIALFHLVIRFYQALNFDVIRLVGRHSLWAFLIHFPIILHFYKELYQESMGSYERLFTLFVLSVLVTIPLSLFLNFLYKKVFSLLKVELTLKS